MAENAAEEAAKIWKKLVAVAEKVREGKIKLDDSETGECGKRLNDYISLRSGMGDEDYRAKARWMSVNDKYRVEETFYKRRTVWAERFISKGPLSKMNVTVFSYKISVMENCSAEEVYAILITLRIFSKESRVDKNILDEIKDVNGEKEISSAEQIKEGVSNDQGSHVLLGKSVYNAKVVRPNVSQYTNQDHTPEITGEDLRKFVIEFIEKMSYRINMSPFRVQGIYNETLDICIVDYINLHKDLKKWEYVRVIYFASGVADEEIQQKMETVHKWVINSKAFVIVACATDAILKHVRENVACNKQNSIMLLCYEHPDEAHIYLKKNPESDKERFEYLKSSSIKYFYYKEDC